MRYLFAVVAGGLLALSATGCVPFVATRYGFPEYYNGRQMGCQGSGNYQSDNINIIAVNQEISPYGCGDHLLVVGPYGYLDGWVVDQCGGCTEHHVDLSDAGLWRVCGDQAGRCTVYVTELSDLQSSTASVQ